MGTLAAAYAETSRFDEVAMAQRVRDLWAKLGSRGMAQANENLLKLYRAHKPCRA